MKCDTAQARLSARFDGEEQVVERDDVSVHLATCEQCSRFQRDVERIRHSLRFEVLDHSPDIATQVTATLEAGPRHDRRHHPVRREPRLRQLVPVAAAVLAGAIVGAALIAPAPGGRERLAAADVPARVLRAQHHIETLSASVVLVERGWHPDVDERRFEGALRYRAPESIALALEDRTAYPTPAWVPNHVLLVVDQDTWWSAGPRDCPSEAQPACTPSQPRVVRVEGREPFATASLVPLDLITPVRSFTHSGAPTLVGQGSVAGRSAIGIMVTAAQVEPLISGLRPAGNLRAVHPGDVAELWLDADALVPLALTVRAVDDPVRARWAAARGYPDRPGDSILQLTLSDVSLNEALPAGAFPPPPRATVVLEGSFTRGEQLELPEPTFVPAGLEPWHGGRTNASGSAEVLVRTWTDGRAWLKVRGTTGWRGSRLFGDPGLFVRPVPHGEDGVAYVSEDGSHVAIHGATWDLVVTGSLDLDALLAVAASLGVRGHPVPAGWPEAASSTIQDARVAVSGLLAPSHLVGFATPAVRIDGTAVTMAVAGPGTTGFLLVQTPGAGLAPPLDPDVVGIRLRGGTGRWSPTRGELEWIEAGVAVSLRSSTLSLGDLIAVAEHLEPL